MSTLLPIAHKVLRQSMTEYPLSMQLGLLDMAFFLGNVIGLGFSALVLHAVSHEYTSSASLFLASLFSLAQGFSRTFETTALCHFAIGLCVAVVLDSIAHASASVPNEMFRLITFISSILGLSMGLVLGLVSETNLPFLLGEESAAMYPMLSTSLVVSVLLLVTSAVTFICFSCLRSKRSATRHPPSSPLSLSGKSNVSYRPLGSVDVDTSESPVGKTQEDATNDDLDENYEILMIKNTGIMHRIIIIRHINASVLFPHHYHCPFFIISSSSLIYFTFVKAVPAVDSPGNQSSDADCESLVAEEEGRLVVAEGEISSHSGGGKSSTSSSSSSSSSLFSPLHSFSTSEIGTPECTKSSSSGSSSSSSRNSRRKSNIVRFSAQVTVKVIGNPNLEYDHLKFVYEDEEPMSEQCTTSENEECVTDNLLVYDNGSVRFLQDDVHYLNRKNIAKLLSKDAVYICLFIDGLAGFITLYSIDMIEISLLNAEYFLSNLPIFVLYASSCGIVAISVTLVAYLSHSKNFGTLYICYRSLQSFTLAAGLILLLPFVFSYIPEYFYDFLLWSLSAMMFASAALITILSYTFTNNCCYSHEKMVGRTPNLDSFSL